MIYCKPIYFHR